MPALALFHKQTFSSVFNIIFKAVYMLKKRWNLSTAFLRGHIVFNLIFLLVS